MTIGMRFGYAFATDPFGAISTQSVTLWRLFVQTIPFRERADWSNLFFGVNPNCEQMRLNPVQCHTKPLCADSTAVSIVKVPSRSL